MILALIVYAFTCWLGLYLLAREPHQSRMRYAGLGLLAYALGLLLNTLDPVAAPLRAAVSIWPPILWLAAIVHLLPEDSALRARMIPPVILGALSAAAAGMLFLPGWVPFVVVAAFILAAWVALWRVGQPLRSRRAWAALLTVELFLGVSAGLYFLPLAIFPADLVLLVVGVDLLGLGLCIGWLDSLEAGEAFTPDLRRSLLAAALTSTLVAAHALLLVGGQPTPLQQLLLFSLTSLAIASAVFGRSLSALLDRLTLAQSPEVQQAQADLQAITEAATRRDDDLDLRAMPPDDFDRLTRRALGYLSDLSRLAASPLARLPIIEARLRERGEPVNTLTRAAELQSLLRERIEQLRPRGNGDFGTTEDWRYYNALYFPYVVGLRPYARADHDGLDPAARAALDWLRTQVPERTLYNWQNAAARLIAQDLRETGSLWQ
jgi:hypothetical protein